MLWNHSRPFSPVRFTSLLTLIAGFVALGSASFAAPKEPLTNRSAIERRENTAQNRAIAPPIAEGLYWIGNTGLGLEVDRGRFRYYDEGGTQQWQSISQLTSIARGVIDDGNSYWCWSQLVPPGTVGNCTAQGWKIANANAREKADKVSPLEFSLGGIRLGDSAAKIRTFLGEPDRVSSNYDEGITFQYSGLEILLGERGAFGMESTSPRYCTPGGVCPGMPFSEVRTIYGAPTVSDRGSEGIFMEYYSVIPEETCWLKIALDARERVKSVEVACAL